tara:strand:- start:259 stop:504 length:246 start_codon:yes stop_codon:yes gene_type:complete
MKFLRITITSILLFIVLLKGLKIYKNFEISKDLKNEKTNRLKKTAEVLSECFDLKNKSKRNLSDSIKLVEYCLKEYGTKIN